MTENQIINAEMVRNLLRSEDKSGLKEILSSSHPADVARLMNDMSFDECRSVFFQLTPQIASEVIMEINDEVRDYILEDMESNRVGEIVDHMASDDAADLLGTLSHEEAKKVLKLIPEEDIRDVKHLLLFEEDSAGGIMQTEVAAVSEDATVQEVIAMLRERKDEMDDVHNIFVTDRLGRLVGGFPVRRLVIESPETRIIDIMERDYISARVNEDQEAVARLFKKYDLISLPVVDDNKRLVGRITIDDIMDVMEEEASEDIFMMAGTGWGDTLFSSPMKSTRQRLPWLFASCIGGIIAMNIIGVFEDTLGRFVALASFMPVILGMGGNVGTQSTTIIVRGLAIGSLDVSTLWKVVFKEIRIGFMLGLFYGLLLALAALAIYSGNILLSFVVGLSMCVSMIIAAAMGTMIPMLLHRAGVDPAVSTGPFVTTSVDIIAILVFFNIATFILF